MSGRKGLSGGGTLVIAADKVPAGGVNRKLHVDGNSAVKFDLSGMDAIPSVMKLFNGVGNSFAVGKNMKLVVPGEVVDRVSKLFVKNGDLEARVAERPTLGADELGGCAVLREHRRRFDFGGGLRRECGRGLLVRTSYDRFAHVRLFA